LSLFNSGAKKLFLGRKNIGGAFAPPCCPPSYAYDSRQTIFFCKQGTSAVDTSVSLNTVYGTAAIKTSTLCEWCNRFKNGQETLEEKECTGRF